MQRLNVTPSSGRRLVASILGLAALAAVMTAPARAQDASPDTARRHVFDACIVDLWKKAKTKPEMDAVSNRCRCASQKAMASLTVEEAETVSWSKPLTGKPRDAVYEALKTCN
ncbi:hypothetical protein ACRC7T_00690 [Segnochrobactraceae bacterium EtOH-i3]